MNIKVILKDKGKLFLNRFPWIYDKIRFFFTLINRRDNLEQKKSYGEKNKNITIYLIRPTSQDCVQGLLSLFAQTMRKIEYAERENFVPFVDFKNYKTQYYDGVNNAWEFYFTQPDKLTEQDVYQSNRVILSGIKHKEIYNMDIFSPAVFQSKDLNAHCKKLMEEHITFQEDVIKSVESEMKYFDVGKSIGVYLRGTDYVKLKPAGEYVQPTPLQVIAETDRFLEKYDVDHIFLVTEDDEIYKQLKEAYSEKLTIVSFDTFVKGYDGQDFLSKSGVMDPDTYRRGLHYLVKMILLSECRYFIGSITMGSIFSYILNGNQYEDEFIFQLGVYK